MKRLALGAAAVGGVAYALHRLVPKAHELHARCREMMRTRSAGAGCRTEETPRCG